MMLSRIHHCVGGGGIQCSAYSYIVPPDLAWPL